MTLELNLQDKKDFIRWFLKRYQMKRRESVWILNYILTHDALLQKTHFVDNAHYCNLGIVMSSTDSSGVPFRFYKGDLMTADADKAHEFLRSYIEDEESVYLEIIFTGDKSAEYMSVLEDNPFVPAHIRDTSLEDKKEAEEFIESMISNMNRNLMLSKIDESLDIGNKEEFLKLTSLLGGEIK